MKKKLRHAAGRLLAAGLAALMAVTPAAASEEVSLSADLDQAQEGQIAEEDFAEELSAQAQAADLSLSGREELEEALAEEGGEAAPLEEEDTAASPEGETVLPEEEDPFAGGQEEILEELEAGEEAEICADLSFDDALPILTNQKYSVSGSENWYKVSLSAAGNIYVSMEWELDGSQDASRRAAYKVYFYNEAQEIIFDTTYLPDYFSADFCLGESQRVGVPAGDYYVVIWQCFSGCREGSFTVNYEQTTCWEREFNETSDTAQQISPGIAWHGTIKSGTDVDWYQFTLSEDGYITLDFELAEKTESSYKYWNLYLYDDQNRLITALSLCGSDTVNRKIGLAAGTYWFCVEASSKNLTNYWYYSYSDYKLEYDFTAASDYEKEYNGYYTKATLLTENEKITGSICTASDIDKYRVEFSGGRAQIEFSHPGKTYSTDDSLWVITLRDGDYEDNIVGSGTAQNGEETTVFDLGELPRGTYYISVAGGENEAFRPADYTVSMSVARSELAAPTIKSLTNAWYGLSLKWTAVKGADSYVIYRMKEFASYDDEDQGWRKVGTTTGTGYYDKTVENGGYYFYIVRSVKDGVEGLDSEEIVGGYLHYPEISSVTNVAGGVQIQWSGIDGATGYYVYRKEGQKGTWTFLKGVSSLNYTDKTAENGKVYYYAIKAAVYWEGTEAMKSASSPARNTYYLKNVYISSLTNSAAGAMKMVSSSNAKAMKYCFKYSESSSMTNPVFVSAAGTTKTVTGLTKGKTYYVQVRAYAKVGGYDFYSAWSSVKSVKITK